MAAAALGALALWVPTGYSTGSLALLIISLVLVVRNGIPHLSISEWIMITVMLGYSALWMLDAGVRGEGIRGMDQASRFIFAVPVLWGAALIALRWDIIWLGLGAGGFGALGIAAFQTKYEGAVRAHGFIGPEPFGNVSVLLAGLALLGAIWFRSQKRHAVLSLFMVAGATASLCAVVLSGTRAAWIAFLPVAFLAVMLAWKYGERRQRYSVAAFIMVGFIIFGGIFAESLKQRAHATYSDLTSYFQGAGEPQSIGIRFELWKGSFYLFAQRPFIGWGSIEYKNQMGAMADAGLIIGSSDGPNHAHNDFIDALAKKGLVGGVLILLLYVVPFFIFLKRFMQSPVPEDRIIAAAGLAVVMSSCLYSMAHTALENNAGVMTYAFWLAIFMGGSCPDRARSGVRDCFE